MANFSFPCFDCGQPAFLIEGSCEWCEPELHRTFREQMDAVAEADAEYFRETGRHPFDDWRAFERWAHGR